LIPIPRVGVAFDADEIVEQCCASHAPPRRARHHPHGRALLGPGPIATGATEELMSFGDPSDARTEDHISGRFG
jgi:hypothetical protein